MIFQSRTSPGFFEDRYKKKSDPWNFAQSEYEQGRFAKIAAAVNDRRYRRVFEPGCSIGTLTERLAAFCDLVEASDFSPTAVEHAQARCAHLPNVTITCAALKPTTKLGGYDLIIFSEIGYYFRPLQWRRAVSRFAASMDPGTTVLASHWLGHSEDHRQEGDEVHAVLEAEPLLAVDHQERHTGFRLTRLHRR